MEDYLKHIEIFHRDLLSSQSQLSIHYYPIKTDSAPKNQVDRVDYLGDF